MPNRFDMDDLSGLGVDTKDQALTTVMVVYDPFTFAAQVQAEDVPAILADMQALVADQGGTRQGCQSYIIGLFESIGNGESELDSRNLGELACSLIWLACTSEGPNGALARSLAMAGGQILRFQVSAPTDDETATFSLYASGTAVRVH